MYKMIYYYIIYSNGDVFNTKTNRYQKQSITREGYVYISFKGKKKKLHRLIGETFIENPFNYPELNHINSNKKDNSVENLEWVTRSQNIKHSIISGTRVIKGCGKTLMKKIIDLNTGIIYIGTKEYAEKLNINRSTLINKLSGFKKNNTSLQYI